MLWTVVLQAGVFQAAVCWICIFQTKAIQSVVLQATVGQDAMRKVIMLQTVVYRISILQTRVILIQVDQDMGTLHRTNERKQQATTFCGCLGAPRLILRSSSIFKL